MEHLLVAFLPLGHLILGRCRPDSDCAALSVDDALAILREPRRSTSLQLQELLAPRSKPGARRRSPLPGNLKTGLLMDVQTRASSSSAPVAIHSPSREMATALTRLHSTAHAGLTALDVPDPCPLAPRRMDNHFSFGDNAKVDRPAVVGRAGRLFAEVGIPSLVPDSCFRPASKLEQDQTARHNHDQPNQSP